MKKLMAFDVDGTLVFDRTIEPANIEAIARWQKAGNLAVCNTGKSIFANRLAFENSGINFDYFVLYTGAVITDASYKILAKKTLALDLVSTAVDYLSQIEGINVYATTLDHDYLLHNGLRSVTNILPSFSLLDCAELKEHEYIGIPIWAPDAKLRDEVYTWIIDTFDGQLDCHRNQDFLDIVPKNCDKGLGLQQLLQHMDGGISEIYTIGDSWNDLEMHRFASHAASFFYSPAEVQEATEYVVDKTYEFIDRALENGK